MTQDYGCQESVDWKTKITDSGYLDARIKIMKKLEGKASSRSSIEIASLSLIMPLLLLSEFLVYDVAPPS